MRPPPPAAISEAEAIAFTFATIAATDSRGAFALRFVRLSLRCGAAGQPRWPG